MSMMGLLSVSLLSFFGAFLSLAKVMMGVLARRHRLPRMQEQRSYEKLLVVRRKKQTLIAKKNTKGNLAVGGASNGFS